MIRIIILPGGGGYRSPPRTLDMDSVMLDMDPGMFPSPGGWIRKGFGGKFFGYGSRYVMQSPYTRYWVLCWDNF